MANVYLIPDKAMNRVVSRHSDVQAKLRVEASKIAARAEANKAPHREAGHLKVEFEPHFKGRYGAIDYRISLIDPNAAGNNVAVSAIEYGHKPGGWYADMPGARYVPGLYILTRAAGLA